MVRSLPPVENVSLFRAEESEVERELRGMLGLAAPEDPERMVSARPSPPGPSRGPDNAAQGIERTSSPRPVPNAAPSIVDPPNPPAALSNPTQVVQAEVPPAATLSPDQEPAKIDLPLPNLVSSTIPSDEGPPPSWKSMTSVGDEDEDEDEEIPSINMDSDSD